MVPISFFLDDTNSGKISRNDEQDQADDPGYHKVSTGKIGVVPQACLTPYEIGLSPSFSQTAEKITCVKGGEINLLNGQPGGEFL